MAIEIRRAARDDYEGILDLQARCYIANLPEDRLAGGFLSVEFSPVQIAAMAEDLGIIITCDGARVIGFMCASRADFTPRPPIFDSMFLSLRGVVSQGERPADEPVFIYGPVCIEEACRGKGLLRGMFSALKRELGGRFDAGVTFVAAGNPHSLDAHTKGLGMADVGGFLHDGQAYRLLTLRMR
jgi:hypothetical protein